MNDFIVRVVEPGTEIEGPDGETIAVTDARAVFRGREIFCTQSIYDALKEKTKER